VSSLPTKTSIFKTDLRFTSSMSIGSKCPKDKKELARSQLSRNPFFIPNHQGEDSDSDDCATSSREQPRNTSHKVSWNDLEVQEDNNINYLHDLQITPKSGVPKCPGTPRNSPCDLWRSKTRHPNSLRSSCQGYQSHIVSQALTATESDPTAKIAYPTLDKLVRAVWVANPISAIDIPTPLVQNFTGNLVNGSQVENCTQILPTLMIPTEGCVEQHTPAQQLAWPSVECQERLLEPYRD
jgi:hypothetical protein